MSTVKLPRQKVGLLAWPGTLHHDCSLTSNKRSFADLLQTIIMTEAILITVGLYHAIMSAMV